MIDLSFKDHMGGLLKQVSMVSGTFDRVSKLIPGVEHELSRSIMEEGQVKVQKLQGHKSFECSGETVRVN